MRDVWLQYHIPVIPVLRRQRQGDPDWRLGYTEIVITLNQKSEIKHTDKKMPEKLSAKDLIKPGHSDRCLNHKPRLRTKMTNREKVTRPQSSHSEPTAALALHPRPVQNILQEKAWSTCNIPDLLTFLPSSFS